jgi:hypothetical protein
VTDPLPSRTALALQAIPIAHEIAKMIDRH